MYFGERRVKFAHILRKGMHGVVRSSERIAACAWPSKRIFPPLIGEAAKLIVGPHTRCSVNRSTSIRVVAHADVQKALDEQLEAQLDAQLDAQIEAQLQLQLDDQLDAMLQKQLEDALDAELEREMDEEIGRQLGDQVCNLVLAG